MTAEDWWIYRGPGARDDRRAKLAAECPPWRTFDGETDPGYDFPDRDSAAWRRPYGGEPTTFRTRRRRTRSTPLCICAVRCW